MPHVPLRERGPGAYAPAYLGSADAPWLEVLLKEVARHRGRPRAELEARLAEPLAVDAARWKVRLCGRVIFGLEGRPPRPKVPGDEVRRTVFLEAAKGGARDLVVARAAEALGLAPEAIDEALFSDLPSRRPVPDVGVVLGPAELAQGANLAMVQALVTRTRSLTIRAIGGARDLVMHAKREGLLCTVSALGMADGYELRLSGPLSLFKKTALYARALAGLVPRLSWCERYTLEAVCETEWGVRKVVVSSGDPLAPCREPVRFESRVEERFVADFTRLAPGWELVRAPPPATLGDAVIFPDFALLPGGDPARAWLLEIVGFWTPGYLAQRLARAPDGPDARLIVCVDDARACTDEDLPEGARLVRFRRRIDPRAVIAATALS